MNRNALFMKHITPLEVLWIAAGIKSKDDGFVIFVLLGRQAHSLT